MEYLASCPLCHNNNLQPYLACKDYTVSHETFQLQRCPTCQFVLTNPRPTEQQLPKYYQSEAYISHSDKSPGLTGRLYKLARTYTLSWKYELVRRHAAAEPRSVLDFGCGTGAFLETCQRHGLKITGVEPSSAAADIARNRTSGQIESSLDAITGTFDAVTLWHVLEHVTQLHETLENLKRHLTENGTMFIAVPNLESADARHYREHWAGYDVPRHLWHFSPSTMEQLIHNHQLTLITVLPMRLDAYYVSLLSETYRRGKTPFGALAKAAYHGWKSNRAAHKTNQYSSLIYIARK